MLRFGATETRGRRKKPSFRVFKKKLGFLVFQIATCVKIVPLQSLEVFARVLDSSLAGPD